MTIWLEKTSKQNKLKIRNDQLLDKRSFVVCKYFVTLIDKKMVLHYQHLASTNYKDNTEFTNSFKIFVKF